jgi:hypothetical protein
MECMLAKSYMKCSGYNLTKSINIENAWPTIFRNHNNVHFVATNCFGVEVELAAVLDC